MTNSVGAIVAAVILGTLAVAVLTITLWSRAGRSERARWWLGSRKRLSEHFVAVGGLAYSAMLAGFATTALTFNTRAAASPVLLWIYLLLMAIGIGLLMSGKRQIPKRMVPKWARSTGRTYSWTDQPTEDGNPDPVGDAAPAFEGDDPPQWQAFARRLSFALAGVDPKVGETINIGLRSPLGTWITIQVKNDGIHLVLPGRPFATADAAQQAIHARLQEVGWEPLDEQHWGRHVPLRFASRHAINGVVTAFRLFEVEDPTKITYRAYVSGPLRNRPLELPELMLEPTRPEITDSFQADAPALGTGALPRMDQEFVAELMAEPQLEPETRDQV